MELVLQPASGDIHHGSKLFPGQPLDFSLLDAGIFCGEAFDTVSLSSGKNVQVTRGLINVLNN
ncbi:hypothetical protein NL518_29350, partial [Klebsiella pneumoniae]|nr:hypothetical protein [Klebsiella pneumoniae]